jgi:hypothetical protein
LYYVILKNVLRLHGIVKRRYRAYRIGFCPLKGTAFGSGVIERPFSLQTALFSNLENPTNPTNKMIDSIAITPHPDPCPSRREGALAGNRGISLAARTSPVTP